MIKNRYIYLISWFIANLPLHAQCDTSHFVIYFPPDSLLMPSQTSGNIKEFPIFPDFSDSIYQAFTKDLFERIYAADSFRVFKPTVRYGRPILRRYIFYEGTSRLIFSHNKVFKDRRKEEELEIAWFDGVQCSSKLVSITYVEAMNRINLLEIFNAVTKRFLNGGEPTYYIYFYVARRHMEEIFLHWEFETSTRYKMERITFGIK